MLYSRGSNQTTSMLPLLLFITCVHVVNCQRCKIIYGSFKTADCRRLHLREIPQNLLEDIDALDLGENSFVTIANESFSRYSNLKVLKLDTCNIKSVESEAFKGLWKLEILSLANNSLNISTNDGLFILRNIPNIIDLDFSSNMEMADKTGHLLYPGAAFQHLKRLQHLTIDLYGHPVFGPEFKHLPLKYIKFKSCHLKNLRNDTFKNFPATLSEIHFSKCLSIQTSQIGVNVLQPFSALSILDLSWTCVTLTKGLELMYPLVNRIMHLVDLSHMLNPRTNKFVIPNTIILTAEMMKHLNTMCIQILNLADNNIVDILPRSLFGSEHLECLEHLDLSGNRFGLSSLKFELPFNTPKLSNLRVFDFSYLALTYLDAVYMPTNTSADQYHSRTKQKRKHDYCEGETSVNVTIPPKLEVLRITHVLGAPPFPQLTLNNITSLRYLDMSYYDIKCFPDIFLYNRDIRLEYLDISGIDCEHYFKKKNLPYFPVLKELYMRDAHFYRAIDKNINIFKNTPTLERLDLDSNYMFTLPSSFIMHLDQLIHLRLSENRLSHIPTAITYLTRLKTLNLKGNRIFTLYPEFTSWLDAQQVKLGCFSLKIRKNDFSCSCENRKFVRWLNSTMVHLDNKTYYCRLSNGSSSNTNTVLMNYHDIFSNCDAFVWLRVGVILLVSFFIVLLPTIVIYNFRWRIIFFCYRKFRGIVENSLKLNYDYDVFISYGYDGYTWVLETLMEQLETKWGFRVCIEDKNFISGRSTFEQIGIAINRSRQIIFVVTSDFMSKPFAAYEIDRTKEARSSRSLQNIIVIALDINIEDIPRELQSLWSDVVVIEWPRHSDDVNLALDNLKTRLLLNF
ncbi:toll-like receptor 4 [Mytilus trossulus]|uniref:toll-like receptor 4 n=1 Tax=Mytilus trossulus TaxID=6551 RepID=UPI0030053751